LIIKETSTITQVIDGPARNIPGQRRCIGIKITTLEESHNCTRCGVRIHRIRIVIVVFRPPLRKKEAGLPEVIAAFERWLKFFFLWRNIDDAL
jgi:hypothetical protein